MEKEDFQNSVDILGLLSPLVAFIGFYSNTVELTVESTKRRPLLETEYTIESFLREKKIDEDKIQKIVSLPYTFKVIVVDQTLAANPT